MRRVILWNFLLVYSFFIPFSLTAQTDSLVKVSDLKFHSVFEQEKFKHLINKRQDFFDLFLAIDEHMNEEEARSNYAKFTQVFDELETKNLQKKKIGKKIKLSYSVVHGRFLKKYNDTEFFPEIFRTGTYNCVSASMLYALVFDSLNIPYKVKASSNHVYLVADPGPGSIVIETTNPGFEQQIFTGEFKQQYVNHLRASKLISDSDYKGKSTEEIFEEKFNAVKDAELSNLPGFQY